MRWNKFHLKTYSKKLKSSLLDDPRIGRYEIRARLGLPVGSTDLQSWLEDLCREAGYAGIDAAMTGLSLPNTRLLVVPAEKSDDVGEEPSTPLEKLRVALILAKTNLYCYRPNAQTIPTRTRLQRNIRLIQLDVEGYYHGMD